MILGQDDVLALDGDDARQIDNIGAVNAQEAIGGQLLLIGAQAAQRADVADKAIGAVDKALGAVDKKLEELDRWLSSGDKKE